MIRSGGYAVVSLSILNHLPSVIYIAFTIDSNTRKGSMSIASW